MRQLLLDFTRAPAPTFANFVHGGNAEAVHALEAAARGEFAEPVIYIWGDAAGDRAYVPRARRQGRREARCARGARESARLRALRGREGVPAEPRAARHGLARGRARQPRPLLARDRQADHAAAAAQRIAD